MPRSPIFPSPIPSPEYFHPIGFAREGPSQQIAWMWPMAHYSAMVMVWGVGYLHVRDAWMMMLWQYIVVQGPMF